MFQLRPGALTTAVCIATVASISSLNADPDRGLRAVAFDTPLSRATRLLVVSPHPDDAVLAAAGLIQRVASSGGAVHIVQMTSGDAFSKGLMAERRAPAAPTADDYRRYGAERERETVASLRALGVRRSNVTFLGFPDDGLCLLASQYEARDGYESPYTKRRSPPYAEQVIRGVTYRGEDVRRELQRVVAAFAPTLVLAPDPRDEHPDHCATHMFVKEALDSIAPGAPRPAVLHYLIHYGAWPAMGTTDGTLGPPPSFPAADGVWRTLVLTPKEAARKKAALAAYKSQLLVIGDLVAGFTRREEVFVGGEPAAPAACWCRGENIAAPPVRTR
jgi:N-acetyl-1-D-myo-inositol-2-amino-2-deoxy-alpha-D-glucopyranoside deacetylase